MGKIISISNHKGGCGKTTTAISLGAALTLKGKRVLLIDMDPQRNLTQSLYASTSENTVYTSMKEGVLMEPIKITDMMDLIPSDPGLAAADMQLSQVERAQVLLRNIMGESRKKYDYILIDTPPSRGIITVNALSASDEVLIPMQAEILSLRGLSDLTELIKLVHDHINPDLRINGVFMVRYDNRKTVSKLITSMLDQCFTGWDAHIYSTRIRDNVAIVESQIQRVDIYRYSPEAKAAKDYMALAEEFLSTQK